MHSEDYSSFLVELMKESDRAAIVLGVAQIDELLLSILKTMLRDARKEVFVFNGPLGTLSSRIELSHAIGVLDLDFRKKLNIVRKIRNECAHDIRNVNLDAGAIANQINELDKDFQNNEFWNGILSECEKLFKISGNRLRLRLAISILSVNLAMIKSRVSVIDTKNSFGILMPGNKM